MFLTLNQNAIVAYRLLEEHSPQFFFVWSSPTVCTLAVDRMAYVWAWRAGRGQGWQHSSGTVATSSVIDGTGAAAASNGTAPSMSAPLDAAVAPVPSITKEAAAPPIVPECEL
jgi:hypothetical protein